MINGILIVSVDGIDTIGKSTHCKMLKENCESGGRKAKVIHFPRYETKIGKVIKEELMKEKVDNKLLQNSCLLDFCNFSDELRRGDFNEFDVLILDRYLLSTAIYAEDKSYVIPKINNLLKAGMVKPDSSLIMYAKNMNLIKERLEKKQNKDSFEKLDFLTLKNNEFKEIMLIGEFIKELNIIFMEV